MRYIKEIVKHLLEVNNIRYKEIQFIFRRINIEQADISIRFMKERYNQQGYIPMSITLQVTYSQLRMLDSKENSCARKNARMDIEYLIDYIIKTEM